METLGRNGNRSSSGQVSLCPNLVRGAHPQNLNPARLINGFFFSGPILTCRAYLAHATSRSYPWLKLKKKIKKNKKNPMIMFINLDQKLKNKNPRIMLFNQTRVATKILNTNTKISNFLFFLSKSQTQTQILTQTQTQKSQTQKNLDL